MTRRAFFSGCVGVATLGLKASPAEQGPVGFELSGHFTRAGQAGDGYYAIGQGLALVIDPERLPTCVNGAEALIGGPARLVLSRTG